MFRNLARLVAFVVLFSGAYANLFAQDLPVPTPTPVPVPTPTPTPVPTPVPTPQPDDGLVLAHTKIIARAAQNDGYSLPAGTILGIADVVLNERGDVAFSVDVVGGTDSQAGIWFVPNGTQGGSAYLSTISGRLLSDPGLNNQGDLVFSQYDFGVNDGLFKHDGVARTTSLMLQPNNDSSFAFPSINNSGKVVLRVEEVSGDHSFRVINGSSSSVIAREGVADARGVTASFLFKPVLNNQGQIAAKVRHGERGQVDESQPDTIRLWKNDGTYDVIATDIDGQPSSLFLGFSNSVGISNNKHVVFVAKISGDKQAIFLYGEGRVKAVAIEGQGDLDTIEAFAPVVNAQGLVAFRGRTRSGKSAIFTGNWDGFRILVKQGDLVPSDIGTAKIYDINDHQGFIGGIALTDGGKLGFHAGILSKDGEQFLGQAVYVISTSDIPAARR